MPGEEYQMKQDKYLAIYPKDYSETQKLDPLYLVIPLIVENLMFAWNAIKNWARKLLGR